MESELASQIEGIHPATTDSAMESEGSNYATAPVNGSNPFTPDHYNGFESKPVPIALDDFDPFATSTVTSERDGAECVDNGHVQSMNTDPFNVSDNKAGGSVKVGGGGLDDSGFASTHIDSQFGGFDFQASNPNGNGSPQDSHATNPFMNEPTYQNTQLEAEQLPERGQGDYEQSHDQSTMADQLRDTFPVVDLATPEGNPMTDSMYGGTLGNGDDNTDQHYVPDVLNNLNQGQVYEEGQGQIEDQPDLMSRSMYDEDIAKVTNTDHGSAAYADEICDPDSYECNEPIGGEMNVETMSEKNDANDVMEPEVNITEDNSPDVEVPAYISDPMTDSMYGAFEEEGTQQHVGNDNQGYNEDKDNQGYNEENEFERTQISDESQTVKCDERMEDISNKSVEAWDNGFDDNMVNKSVLQEENVGESALNGEEEEASGEKPGKIDDAREPYEREYTTEEPDDNSEPLFAPQHVVPQQLEMSDNRFADDLHVHESQEHQEDDIVIQDAEEMHQPALESEMGDDRFVDDMNQLADPEAVGSNKYSDDTGSQDVEMSMGSNKYADDFHEPQEVEPAGETPEEQHEYQADSDTAVKAQEEVVQEQQSEEIASTESQDIREQENIESHDVANNDTAQEGTPIDSIPPVKEPEPVSSIATTDQKNEESKKESAEVKETTEKNTTVKSSGKKATDLKTKSTSARLSSKAKTNLTAESPKEKKPPIRSAITSKSSLSESKKSPAATTPATHPIPSARAPVKSTRAPAASARAPTTSPRAPGTSARAPITGPPRAPVTGLRKETTPKSAPAAKSEAISKPQTATPKQSTAPAARKMPPTRPAPKVAPSSTPKSAPAAPKTATTPRTALTRPTASSATRSKIGSLENAKHTPDGGRVTTVKQDLCSVGSRCGSLDNASHKPKGGDKKIENQKLNWKTSSKVRSLDNAKHTPGGGEKKIEERKLDWKVTSKIGSLDNTKHKPGGGEKRIETKKLDFKNKVSSRVGSLDNAKHKPGGGEKKIESHKVEIKASSKIGSLDNATHRPGGGDKKIETAKLHFKEQAVARTDHGGHSPATSSSKSNKSTTSPPKTELQSEQDYYQSEHQAENSEQQMENPEQQTEESSFPPQGEMHGAPLELHAEN